MRRLQLKETNAIKVLKEHLDRPKKIIEKELKEAKLFKKNNSQEGKGLFMI